MSLLFLLPCTLLFCVTHSEILNLISPTNSTNLIEIFDTNTTDEFEYGTIICSKPECIIICDTESGCSDLTIHSNESDILTLICSDRYSCQWLTIFTAPRISTHIDCIEDVSCRSAKFNVDNSLSVDINCEGEETCGNAYIYAQNSSNLSVRCSGNYSCSQMEIHCPFSLHGECDIDCGSLSGYHQCKGLDIYGRYTENNVNIDCSTDSTQCIDGKMFCDYESIWDHTPYSRMSNFEYLSGVGWICSMPWYYFEYSDCCPFEYDITLDCNKQNATCSIDCSTMDCSGYVIDGSVASSSFIVNCSSLSSSGGCRGATIICPNNICNVNCYGNNSCEMAIIRGSDDGGYVALECHGNMSCESMVILVDNVTSFTLDVDSNGFGFGQLWSRNVDCVTITCSSEIGTNAACHDTTLHLTDYGRNTNINCYGDGCKDFGNIVVNTSLSLLNVNVIGCQESFNCIGSWRIVCGPRGTYISYDGSLCFGGYPYGWCDCWDFAEQISFDGDVDSNCMVLKDDGIDTGGIIIIVVVVVSGSVLIVCLIILSIYMYRKRKINPYTKPDDDEGVPSHD